MLLLGLMTSSHLLLLAALLRKNSNYKNVADWIGLLKQPRLVYCFLKMQDKDHLMKLPKKTSARETRFKSDEKCCDEKLPAHQYMQKDTVELESIGASKGMD